MSVETTGTPLFERIDHVSLTVPDLAAAAAFYKAVFGAEELFSLGPMDGRDIPPDEQGRDWMATHVNVPDARLSLVMLKLAPNMKLQLVQYDRPKDEARLMPRNCDPGGRHVGFIVSDIDAAAKRLAENGCTVFEQIVVPEGAGAGRFHYVLDPWGNQIELCQYAPA
ncbi:MAG: VOC family protein [Caulobacteraceae bacterium]